MKKILVATDGSVGAQAAVAWAAEFASAMRAKVVVASAWESTEAGSSDSADGRGLAAELLASQWSAPLASRSVDHETVLLEGDARREVLLAATGSDVDAVVVGTRGSGGFQGLGLGGVSHYLARHVPCPLIAVPAAGGALRGGTIVAGADATPANEAALCWAADVARAVDGRLVAAFVHSAMADVMTHTAANWEYPGEREVRAQVARASAGADAELVLSAGNPVEELIRLGAERDAGLIVVGRRGRGGLHGLLLGRVPAQLLHHAGRPVAVVPH